MKFSIRLDILIWALTSSIVCSCSPLITHSSEDDFGDVITTDSEGSNRLDVWMEAMDAKKAKYPCYSELAWRLHQLKHELRVRRETEGSLRSMVRSFDRFSMSCIPEIETIINFELNQLGFVGDLIRRWMDLSVNLEVVPPPEEEDELIALEQILTQDIERYKTELEAKNASERIAQVSIGNDQQAESSTSQSQNQTRADQTSIELDLLKMAVESGSGICVHLRDEPLGYLASVIILIETFEREESIELAFINHLDQQANNSLIYRMLTLRNICVRLRELPDSSNIIGYVESESLSQDSIEANVDQIMRANDREILDGSNFKCDWTRFHAISESFDLLQAYYGPNAESLIYNLSSITDELLKACLRKLDNSFSRTLESVIRSPNYNQNTETFLRELENRIETTQAAEGESMLMILNSRSQSMSNLLSRLFFGRDRPYQFDLIKSFHDGSIICDMFKSNEWKTMYSGESDLAAFYEKLNELLLSPNYVPKVKNLVTNLYYLKSICKHIMMLPLDYASSSES